MAFDVVKQIIDVEKEGENLIKDAQYKVQEILKSAGEQSQVIIQKANEDARVYYENVVLKYENEARKYLTQVQEENRIKRENLSKISAGLIDRAVNLVIERIVNSHGDS